jgi:hypothetical protein
MVRNDNFTWGKFRRNPLRVLDWSLRYLTAGGRAAPDFLIIGTQKGGTTSLYAWLEAHPNLLGAYRKEVKYFDCNYPLGPRWYRSHFPDRAALHRQRALTGEASPYYMYHPAAAGRIRRDLPGVRMIALLRDPVERAYSDYQHMFRSGRETLGFDQALEAEAQRLQGEAEKICRDPRYSVYQHMHFSYQARGRYVEQLTRLFDLFPREQVLVLRSEDLFAEPASVFARVLRFLGLPDWQAARFQTLNRGEYSGMPAPIRARLAGYFKPYNRQLEDLLGMKMGWA